MSKKGIKILACLSDPNLGVDVEQTFFKRFHGSIKVSRQTSQLHQVLKNDTIDLFVFEEIDEDKTSMVLTAMNSGGNSRTPLVFIPKNIIRAKNDYQNYKNIIYARKTPSSSKEFIQIVNKVLKQKAINATKKEGFKLDISVITPFIEKLLETLKSMGKIENIKTGKPSMLTKEKQGEMKSFITGVIPLVASDFKANLYVSFQEKIYKKIVYNILGDEDPSPDIAAEIANIVYGYGRGRLTERGIDIEQALPETIQGNLNIVNQDFPVINVPFVSTEGFFFLSVAILEKDVK